MTYQQNFKVDANSISPQSSGIAQSTMPMANLLTSNDILLALNKYAIVAITDKSGIITEVNDKFCTISKFSRSELVGKSHSIVNSGHHNRAFFIDLWTTISKGFQWSGDICNKAKDGSLYWVETTIVPITHEGSNARGYLSIRHDITDRKISEKLLNEALTAKHDSGELLKDVIENIPNSVAAFDSDDRLLLYNSAFKQLTSARESKIAAGVTFEEILRQNVKAGLFSLDRKSDDEKESWCLARLHAHKKSAQNSLMKRSNGSWWQVQERISASGIRIVAATDVTDIKAAEIKIKHQFEHDPLTSLYNRAALLDRLSAAFEMHSFKERPSALIIFSLDKLKTVNDSFGHDIGDKLLLKLIGRIQPLVRTNDILARLGGSEFAIVLGGLILKRNVEHVVRDLLQTVQIPFHIDGHSIQQMMKVGIAMVRHGDKSVEDLIKRATLALNDIQQDQHHFYGFDNDMNEHDHVGKVAPYPIGRTPLARIGITPPDHIGRTLRDPIEINATISMKEALRTTISDYVPPTPSPNPPC